MTRWRTFSCFSLDWYLMYQPLSSWRFLAVSVFTFRTSHILLLFWMTLAAFSSFWMRFRVIAPRMFFCSRAIAFCSWALDMMCDGSSAITSFRKL